MNDAERFQVVLHDLATAVRDALTDRVDLNSADEAKPLEEAFRAYEDIVNELYGQDEGGGRA